MGLDRPVNRPVTKRDPQTKREGKHPIRGEEREDAHIERQIVIIRIYIYNIYVFIGFLRICPVTNHG